MSIPDAALFVLALGLVGALRLGPRWSQRDFGVDSWYFLSSARILRARRRVPHRMPYYLLDIEEQWYPPMFALVLSWCDPEWLTRHHHWVSPAVEVIHAGVAGLVAGALAGPDAAWTAVIVYATWPILTAQHTDLNSRAFGSLVLTVVMLATFGLWRWPSAWTFAIAVLAGSALLLTHKLATQQWIVLAVGLSLWLETPLVLVAALATPGAAWLVSGGFYGKVIRGHVEILTFWRKRLPWVGAHLVYESPLYYNPDKARSHRGVSGLRGRPVAYRLAQLYMALPLSLFLLASSSAPVPEIQLFIGWMSLTYATVVVVSYFKPVRFLGEGFRYSVYAAFPVSIVVSSLVWRNLAGAWSALVVVAWAAAGLALTVVIIKGQRANFISSADRDFKAAAAWLRDSKARRILCLPITKCDPVAFLTDKQVLMGAHSSGYDALTAFFPVLQKPVEFFVEHYDIDYLLIDTRYVDLGDLKLPPSYSTVVSFGPYRVLYSGKPARGTA
jgi:hypothetical protein